MKSLISNNESESKMSKVWGQDILGTKNSGSFSVSVPLHNIFGFVEDYKKST